MKLVIDIPEKLFNIAKDGMLNEIQSMFICGSVSQGTPLPKGHGDLKDVNLLSAIFTEQYPKNYMNDPELSGAAAHFSLRHVLQILNSESCAPTIIESDKAESEVEE